MKEFRGVIFALNRFVEFSFIFHSFCIHQGYPARHERNTNSFWPPETTRVAYQKSRTCLGKILIFFMIFGSGEGGGPGSARDIPEVYLGSSGGAPGELRGSSGGALGELWGSSGQRGASAVSARE